MGFHEQPPGPEVPTPLQKPEPRPPQEVPVVERHEEPVGHEGATVEVPKGPDAGTATERKALEDSEGRYFKEMEYQGHHIRVSWDPEWEVYAVYIPEMAPEAPDSMVRISEKSGDAQKVMMAAGTYIERGMRGRQLYDALDQYVKRNLG